MNADWTLILIGALVTWRVTRFIVADDLIEGVRAKVIDFVQPRRPLHKGRDFLFGKAYTLITCPWCVSIYVSAGFLLLSRWLVVDSIPVPVWTWLAVGALSILPYQFADGDWIVTLQQKQKKDEH